MQDIRNEARNGPAAQQPRGRCIIFDPSRYLGGPRDTMMSDLIARAFFRAGHEVLWLVDKNDPMGHRAYATVLKVLEPPQAGTPARLPSDHGLPLDGGEVPAPSRDLGEPNQSNGAIADKNASVAIDLSGQPRATLVERVDMWARRTWHSQAPVRFKVVALVMWLAIRTFYRFQFVYGHTSWRIRRFASWVRWRISSGSARAYWFGQYWWRLGRPALSLCLQKMRRLGSAAKTVLAKNRAAPREPGGSANWEAVLTGAGPEDVIVVPAATWRDLESILGLLPTLRLSKPLRTTLHFRFAVTPKAGMDRASCDVDTLGRRLASGSPFRTIVFHANDATWCQELSRCLGLPVYLLPNQLGDQALLDRFGCLEQDGARTGSLNSSLTVDDFGPIVLLVSALWGRVGSTASFDSQTKYFIDRGCIVARVFIEHYPHSGTARRKRIASFLSENFSVVRPHFHILAERNDDVSHLAHLMALPQFQQGSPVARVGMLLADARTDCPEGLAWAASRAAVAIVNHLPHVRFTQKITAAPAILLTHDLYSELLTTHGIPGFIPPGPDGDALRQSEEREIWRDVAACVNVSPHDHEVISRVARISALAKPYSPRRRPTIRPWSEVLQANDLGPAFRTTCEFDIMLWGSWHEGNVAGIAWFLNKVLPLHPSLHTARIVIVGRVREGMPPQLTQHRQVVLAGFVDRLDDFALRSKVLVIPDQAGTGISVKLIDAVALGACFACTTSALRGFDVGETGFTPSMDAQALADDVAALLASPDARRVRAEMAGQLHELNFSEAAYSNTWDSVLDLIVPGLIRDRESIAAVPAVTSITVGRTVASSPPNVNLGDRPSSLPRSYPTKPKLSVVVCTYERYDLLDGAIASLMHQQLDAAELEMIVVDNSPSKDQATAAARRYAGSPVRYILEAKPGLSNARNLGVAEARAGRVAFIDDDAIAAPDWARRLLDAFEAFGPRAGIVGGRILPRWTTERPSWLPDDLLKFLTIIDWGGELRELPRHQWLAGCNIAYDKSCLIAAGGFSTSLGRSGSGLTLLSSEETEVTGRIESMGRVSIYAPEARVEHIIDPSRLTPQWFRRRMAWQAVSEYLKDPKRVADYAPAAAERVRQYMRGADHGMPPGLSGVAMTPSEFTYDVGLVYDLVVATLAGGVDVDGSVSMGAMVKAKAIAQGREFSSRMPGLAPLLRVAYRLAQAHRTTDAH